MATVPTVYVVDDDSSVRTAIRQLVRSAGFDVKTFSSAQELLDHGVAEGPCCLVVDVRMPGMNGLLLCERGKLSIKGFGIFEVRVRKGRIYKHPLTGEDIRVGDREIIAFKPSARLIKDACRIPSRRRIVETREPLD